MTKRRHSLTSCDFLFFSFLFSELESSLQIEGLDWLDEITLSGAALSVSVSEILTLGLRCSLSVVSDSELAFSQVPIGLQPEYVYELCSYSR